MLISPASHGIRFIKIQMTYFSKLQKSSGTLYNKHLGEITFWDIYVPVMKD